MTDLQRLGALDNSPSRMIIDAGTLIPHCANASYLLWLVPRRRFASYHPHALAGRTWTRTAGYYAYGPVEKQG